MASGELAGLEAGGGGGRRFMGHGEGDGRSLGHWVGGSVWVLCTRYQDGWKNKRDSGGDGVVA